MMEILKHLILSFVASFGFAIIFNIKGKNIFFASLGGTIAWSLYIFLQPIIPDDIIRYFLASVCISVYSQEMAKFRKSPVLVFLVIAFIPLVPGYNIYKTMENLLISNIDEFVIEGIYTFKVVMAIATGFLITNKLFSNIKIKKVL